MQWLPWLESGWNGLEKSTCNDLDLVMEDEEDGVTVGKQGQGWVLFDVRKLWKLFWGKTHDGNGNTSSRSDSAQKWSLCAISG